uniref:sensor histidine kinase n=1 Tax=Agathobacter rectalis TaxID=39491 RepID=UPI00280598CF|nr:histidine kinase [uncultured Agathobacter sp.]
MYKICSQFLIVLSCVMLMVVSLQVDYVMIACILTGIIVCTFIDMQDMPQMSPANKSKTADRALDLILAVYILSGVFFAPSFFMLPYAAMVFRKRKYTVSRMAAAVVGIAVFVDCILRIKHIAPGFGRYLWLTKLQDTILNDILEVVLLMAFAIMLSYFTELLWGYQMKLHSMRDASMEHDMLMEQMNHQLIEKQNAQIYNATLKERNRIAREIHDNVGHMITRSILQVGAIGVINTDERLKAPISDLKSTLDTAMDSMRKSVHDLYDESVDLRQALAKLKPTDSAFAFSLEYDCEDDVQRDVKYAFIAIAKEAVNNAVKHSNGDEIRIIVREHPAFYQLEIMDNGTSVDERSLSGETGDGIGIKNIKERVAAIGGTMRIKADDGFRIFVTLMKK